MIRTPPCPPRAERGSTRPQSVRECPLKNVFFVGECFFLLDTTVEACRTLIWTKFLKPRYYSQGVSAYWLDETDGEGTGIADGEYG